MELILFFFNLLLIIGYHLSAGTKNGKLNELILQFIIFCLVLSFLINFIKIYSQNENLKSLFIGVNIAISIFYIILLFISCKK